MCISPSFQSTFTLVSVFLPIKTNEKILIYVTIN